MFGAIVLLSFGGSLVTNYVSLNNEPCMVRCTPADLNPVELDFYLFMISRNKCNVSCNAANDLSKNIF